MSGFFKVGDLQHACLLMGGKLVILWTGDNCRSNILQRAGENGISTHRGFGFKGRMGTGAEWI